MASLVSLPLELLWNIIYRLEIEDVINLSRTSTSFNEFVSTNEVSRAVMQVREIIPNST